MFTYKVYLKQTKAILTDLKGQKSLILRNFWLILAKLFGSCYHGNGRVNKRNNSYLFVFMTKLTLSASLNKIRVGGEQPQF